MDDATDQPTDAAAAPAAPAQPPSPAAAELAARRERDAAVVAELEQVLVERGALPLDELAVALSERAPDMAASLLSGTAELTTTVGPDDEPPRNEPGAKARADLAAAVEEVARQSDAIWRLPDGRVAAVLHDLRRSTFTHRVTAAERAREVLDLCPDLVALALPRAIATADGTELRVAGWAEEPAAAEEGSLCGPPGWLDRFPEGQLVAVRYDGEVVSVEPIADAALDRDAGDAVATAFADTFGLPPSGRAPEAHRLVVDTMGLHPGCFARPVAPVGELLARAGLRARQAWVGPADEDWTTPAEDSRQRRLEELLSKADGCCRRAARRAADAWDAWLRVRTDEPTSAPEPVTAAEATSIIEDVEHGPTASVLTELAALTMPRRLLPRLGQWAAELGAVTDHPTAGLSYLRARGADAAGDAEEALAHLDAGLRAAPDHPACLGLLSELTADQGDAQTAVDLLQRAGRAPSDATLAELQPFLISRRVGRNDPCPCGSGRKFKHCCANRPIQLPLAQRCRWLLTRAARHATRFDPLSAATLRQLFDSSIGGGASDALVADMLLFPNGGLGRYLDARGALLPADEAACARRWTAEPMRLLRVETVPIDGRAEASDVSTDERLSLVHLDTDVPLELGQTLLGRALPVEDAWLLGPAVVNVPEAVMARARALVAGQVHPFALLELLVEIQVAALRPPS